MHLDHSTYQHIPLSHGQVRPYGESPTMATLQATLLYQGSGKPDPHLTLKLTLTLT